MFENDYLSSSNSIHASSYSDGSNREMTRQESGWGKHKCIKNEGQVMMCVTLYFLNFPLTLQLGRDSPDETAKDDQVA